MQLTKPQDKLSFYKEVIVLLASCVQLFATPWTAACRVSLSLTISWSLPEFMFIASVMPSSHLILCCPFLLLPSVFPSMRDFSNEGFFQSFQSVPIRWAKYYNFRFSIVPSSEYSGLISLKIDWLDLLAVQGTFRNLLPHHSLKVSILWHSAFFTVHLWVATGKNHSLDYTNLCWQSNVSQYNSLLTSWLQSSSTVILEFKKRKSVTTSTFPPSICHAVMRPDAMILVFYIFSLEPALALSSFTFIKKLFSSSSLDKITFC